MRYKFSSRGEGEEGIGVENSKIENFTKFVQDHFVIQFEAKSLLSRRQKGSVKKNLISKENLLFK